MDEQSAHNDHSELAAPDMAQPSASDQQPDSQVADVTVPPGKSKVKIYVKFITGFIGWFLISTVLWMNILGFDSHLPADDIAVMESILISSICYGPVSLLILAVLFVIRWTRLIAWGVLSAIGLNLLVSLLLGSVLNGFCMVPFIVGN